MSKGFTYLLTRLRGTELLVGSAAQTIDEIKSLLMENGVPIEIGLAELHQVANRSLVPEVARCDLQRIDLQIRCLSPAGDYAEPVP